MELGNMGLVTYISACCPLCPMYHLLILIQLNILWVLSFVITIF